MFAIGLGAIFLEGIRHRSIGRHAQSPGLWIQVWRSAHAGVFEEIVFRWMLVVVAMTVIHEYNVLTSGLIRSVYLQIAAPVVNWASLGALQPHLMDESRWLLGAGLMAANGAFSLVHRHVVHNFIVWFIGMALFYVALTYGLLASIVVHVLHNVCIDVAESLVDRWISPSKLS